MDIFRDRLAHQLEARIGDERRAGVADQRHALPALEPCDQPRPLPRRIVVVVGDERLGDAVDGQKLRGDARVFGRDHVATFQHIQRPQRHVARMADRRGRHIEARAPKRLATPGSPD